MKWEVYFTYKAADYKYIVEVEDRWEVYTMLQELGCTYVQVYPVKGISLDELEAKVKGV